MRALFLLLAGFAFLLPPAPASGQGTDPELLKKKGITGTVYQYTNFPSKLVKDRNVEVWLPPGYGKERGRRYPVLYMHDGQNLFNPGSSYGSQEWGVDETMTRQIAEGAVPEALVVAIWNTGELRAAEYMPQIPYEEADSADKALVLEWTRQAPLSDRYLRFLVEELKPFIDSHYHTLKDRENTAIMGSSMGGLISLYAICEYPQVFGAAGCISTHWPIGDGLVIDYLPKHLPDPRTHKIYYDHGNLGLDSAYEEYQVEVDSIMEKDGYTPGKNWISFQFPGETHSEVSWRKRLDVPLKFLLPEEKKKKKPGKAPAAKKEPDR